MRIKDTQKLINIFAKAKGLEKYEYKFAQSVLTIELERVKRNWVNGKLAIRESLLKRYKEQNDKAEKLSCPVCIAGNWDNYNGNYAELCEEHTKGKEPIKTENLESNNDNP